MGDLHVMPSEQQAFAYSFRFSCSSERCDITCRYHVSNSSIHTLHFQHKNMFLRWNNTMVLQSLCLYISSFILYHLFYLTMPFAVLMGFQVQCLVHPKSLEQLLFSFCFKSEFVVILWVISELLGLIHGLECFNEVFFFLIPEQKMVLL